MKIGNEEGYKVGFWNLARLKNKDREFWESLREWDIIFMKRGYRRWERVKKWLPKGYIWEYNKQKEEVKTGGMMGRREGIEERKERG